jgi:hypothetical protein
MVTLTSAGAVAFYFFNRSGGGGGGGGWGIPVHRLPELKEILLPPPEPIFYEIDDFLKNAKNKQQ